MKKGKPIYKNSGDPCALWGAGKLGLGLGQFSHGKGKEWRIGHTRPRNSLTGLKGKVKLAGTHGGVRGKKAFTGRPLPRRRGGLAIEKLG